MTTLSPSRRRWPAALLLLLAAAFALRMVLAVTLPGYPYDTGTFYSWAISLAKEGPSVFYTSGFFADYPPGYLYVLWGAGLLLRALGIQGLSGGAMAVLCLFPILCDLALAALLWRLALPRAGERAALAAAAAAAFNPAFLFDCAVWKQVDAALALALVLCFLLLSRGHWYAAALAYAAALLIKPQALLFGPPFALGYLLALPRPASMRTAGKLLGRLLAAAALCIGAVLLVSAPFTGSQTPVLWLVRQYFTTATSYPYASVNAFNLIALLGGNWQDESARFLLLRWKDWGTLFILLLTAALALGALRGRRRGKADLLLLAAFYGSGIFLFAHRMHERYLFPALALLLAAWARSGDRRLRWPALLFSLSLLTNMAAVYLSAERDTFLEGEGVRLVMRIAAIAALAGFALLARACRQICSGQPAPEPAGGRHRPDLSSLARRLLPAPPDPIPRWSRRDTLAVLLLTLFAGCISLPYLGTRSVPQTGCTGPLEAEITLPADAVVDSVWIYPGISEGTLTLTDGDGQTVCSFSLSVGSCFGWQRQEVLTDAGSFTLTLTGGTVNELVLVDREGRAIPPASVTPAGGANALFDEADTLPERPSQLNGMYFDEIYHGRTGFETLHGLPIYETTHPPLGKDLIAVGIALFGMNPFGWRIMGALFGVAMVPVFYLLARGLFGRRRLCAALTFLFAVDFMRYTQSRIATIDVFVVFFILLSAACLVWFCRRFLARGRHGALLPAALGGVSFGLACASKWTGLYAGAAFAAVYFLAMALRWRSLRGGPGRAEGRRDLLFALWAGVLFYVAVPLAIYIASYLPIQLGSGEGFSLSGIWQAQLSMFRYHSQLTATHPFESRWYTWPLILRPVWYYMGTLLPEGTVASIAVLGNPIVWWGGLAGLLWTALRLPRTGPGQRFSRWFVLLLYLIQLLPWVFVSRATFLYHYFPAMPFALLGLGGALDLFRDRCPRAAGRLTLLLCGGAAALFVLFFPALSGLPVPAGYAALLQWLPGWSFYLV